MERIFVSSLNDTYRLSPLYYSYTVKLLIGVGLLSLLAALAGRVKGYFASQKTAFHLAQFSALSFLLYVGLKVPSVVQPRLGRIATPSRPVRSLCGRGHASCLSHRIRHVPASHPGRGLR
ncbi:MAG: hypothetical protein P4M11_10835 [Candidatus Pacebacteria bacterium]|nr:hypothetical protein [Candidatus Paceibacterota bacterium]